MDDKERLRRRKEALLNARRRGGRWDSRETGWKEAMIYRAYVTAVIVGLTVALSLFPTESAQQVTSNIKQAIAHQVSADSMRQTLENTTAMLKRLDLSVDKVKNKKTPEDPESNTEPAVPASNEFRPDLPEDDP